MIIQKRTTQKVLISLFVIMLVIMTSTYSFAGTSLRPSDITGEAGGDEIDLGFIDDISDLIRLLGTFLAVGAMMVIGIRYITGSVEEKANYKKSMVPYLAGCFILFGASFIAPQLEELFSDIGTDSSEIGNSILGIIQAIGTIITVAVLMILGIKYMVGSIEERAAYKKSMIPYIVGVILLFAAVNLTAVIYDMIPHEEQETTTGQTYERDENGNPICAYCGDELGVGEQRRGYCSNCGESTGI